MRSKSPYAPLVLLVAFISVALFGLVHALLGNGRSLGAYLLGTLALLVCLGVVLAALTAIGWIVDWIANFLKNE